MSTVFAGYVFRLF